MHVGKRNEMRRMEGRKERNRKKKMKDGKEGMQDEGLKG